MSERNDQKSFACEEKVQDNHRVCFRCGECCVRYQVYMNLAEARHIAEEMSVSWSEFVDKYIDGRWPGTESLLLKQENGHCVFLVKKDGGKEMLCKIQPYKPASCRDWEPDLHRRECKEGLSKYWGLEVSPSGKPKGEDDKARGFESFLKSL